MHNGSRSTGRGLPACRVACLDVWAPAVQRAVLDAKPPALELRFAASYDPAEQLALAAEADVLVPGFAPVSASLLSRAPHVRMIQKWGIGVDKIDVAAAQDRGIEVYITSGANDVQVAEHTRLLMLATLRKLTYAQKAMQRVRCEHHPHA